MILVVVIESVSRTFTQVKQALGLQLPRTPFKRKIGVTNGGRARGYTGKSKTRMILQSAGQSSSKFASRANAAPFWQYDNSVTLAVCDWTCLGVYLVMKWDQLENLSFENFTC